MQWVFDRFLPREGTGDPAVREALLIKQRRRLDFALRIVFLLACPAYAVVVIQLLGKAMEPIDPGFLLHYGGYNPLLIAVACIICLVYAGLRFWSAHVDNALAKLLFCGTMPSGTFVLYLRSFFVDETLTSSDTSLFLPSNSNNESLQVRLARSMGFERTIVKIGSRALFDATGGTLRPEDATWFDDFKKLAERAHLIVMTPIVLNPNSGTADELREIANRGWRYKTIFLAPQNGKTWIKYGWFYWRVPVRDLWSRSRAIVRELTGFEMPPYRRSAILIPGPQGWTSVAGVAGRPWDHPRSLRYLLDATSAPETTGRCAVRIANRMTFVQLLLWPILLVSVGAIGVQFAEIAGLDSLTSPAYFLGVMLFLTYPYFYFCRKFTVSDVEAFGLYAATITFAIAGLAISSYSKVYSSFTDPVLDRMGIVEHSDGAWLVFVVLFGPIWLLTFGVAYLALRTCRPIPRWQGGAQPANVSEPHQT